MGNGEDMGGEKEKRRQERVGSVAAYPSNPGNSKEAGRGEQCIQGLSKNGISRECVSSLSHRIRGSRDKY